MYTQWTAPSVTTLQRSGILEKVSCSATTIRAVWKARTLEELEALAPDAFSIAGDDVMRPLPFKRTKMLVLNYVLDMHGIEYLGKRKRTRQCVDYLNAGDAYAATLIFEGSRMTVGCWGDLIESGTVAPFNHHTGSCE